MRQLLLFLLLLSYCSGDDFATYIKSGTTGSTPEFPMGVYPDSPETYWKRPYKVEFTSKFDGRTDSYTIAFPHNFDPSKKYPLWFKFKPYYGSGTNTDYPTFAWNLCDSQDVIFVGANLRGPDGWFGDNTKLDSLDQANISKDMVELTNQLATLFNITYVASFGASMGGYSSLRFLTHLPKEYVGAAVPSCPALYFRSWCADGSDSISRKVEDGFFNDVFVTLMHGDEDNTVSIQQSIKLTAKVPDLTWWNFVTVEGGGHSSFFATDGGPFPYTEQWGISPVVPDIWERIEEWEAAFPGKSESVINPSDFGWESGVHWYLPQNICEASVKGSTPLASVTAVKRESIHLQNRKLILPHSIGEFTLSLYDLHGRELFRRSVIEEATLPREIGSGVYLMKLSSNSVKLTQKISLR